MSVGRNDPCPCGSGKKYKKCCLMTAQPKPEDLFWHRLHSVRNGLISKILSHTTKVYGEVAIHEAWDEFHLWEGIPFDPNSPELQTFMPWFFYDWTPDSEGTEVNSDTLLNVAPAQAFLEAKARSLDPLERTYIEACLRSPFSFFEIIECYPGSGFKLKDIFTGEILDVVEKRGSENARIGDMLFGKPATVNNVTTLEACSPFLVPPVRKAPLIELRKQMAKHFKPLTHEALQAYGIELIELYQQFYEALLNPNPPKLSNTDGDPLVPQKLIFDIQSPNFVFDALHELDFEDTKEELLESAELDSQGTLKKIEFPWLRKGNKQNKAWQNTVLGHITIEGCTLTVNVNSERRADLFRKELKKRISNGVRYKTTVIEPIESALSRSAKDSNSHTSNLEDQNKILQQNPEVQRHIAKMMEAHWDNWIHEKVPALKNKTPIQAAKSKEGREMLHALLTQFERSAVDRPQPGVTVQTFKKIREQLGL